MSWTREQLEALKQQPATVPCDGCRACCSCDRVFLSRDDDPSAYRWHVEDGYPVLDRKPNGECIYLSASGCEVHERAPQICRRFDCRVLYLLTDEPTRERRQRENPQMAEVYLAGRKRLPTLKAPSTP